MRPIQPPTKNSAVKWSLKLVVTGIILLVALSCTQKNKMKESNQSSQKKEMTAKEILGNPKYLAISYEGYRLKSRELQPTVDELKEDLRILFAMGIRIVRTYNVQLPHASNVLKAIRSLKSENSEFEMYVMLGAWIDCKNAWTDQTPDHNIESEQNEGEIGSGIGCASRMIIRLKFLSTLQTLASLIFKRSCA